MAAPAGIPRLLRGRASRALLATAAGVAALGALGARGAGPAASGEMTAETLEIAYATAPANVAREVIRPPASRRDRPLAPLPPAAPRIAIVFDDLGYVTDGLAADLLAIDAPITFAVLPGLARSAAFVAAARARGHEVLLHLPMEPLDAVRHDPGRDAIRVHLPPEENARRVDAFLDAIPDYAGVSNHMGSRVTATPELVDLVLARIRARGAGLFFVDSRTTPLSVVPERARRAGVPFVCNDLFLDGGDEAAALPEVRTERLEALARRRGYAVGIGHVRPATVAAVRDAVERWKATGIRLVPVSELTPRGATEERLLARR